MISQIIEDNCGLCSAVQATMEKKSETTSNRLQIPGQETNNGLGLWPMMKKLVNYTTSPTSSPRRKEHSSRTDHQDAQRRDGREDDETNDVIATKITKEDVFEDGSAFVLRNFLTPRECRSFVAQAENFGLVDCGYSIRIRKTDRVSAESDEVANWLFDRLLPWLDPSIIDLSSTSNDAYPKGVCSKTIRPYVWHPFGLNPVFRICRYQPTGFFLPHHDGGFKVTEFRRSVKTCMIYLNDDFEGGETCFFNELQQHYNEPVLENVLHKYAPRTGDALIFNSAITHDGGRVRSGQKYIMRTEVMYHAPEEEEDFRRRRNRVQMALSSTTL